MIFTYVPPFTNTIIQENVFLSQKPCLFSLYTEDHQLKTTLYLITVNPHIGSFVFLKELRALRKLMVHSVDQALTLNLTKKSILICTLVEMPSIAKDTNTFPTECLSLCFCCSKLFGRISTSDKTKRPLGERNDNKWQHSATETTASERKTGT